MPQGSSNPDESLNKNILSGRKREGGREGRKS
jgi:hypothetical protein